MDDILLLKIIVHLDGWNDAHRCGLRVKVTYFNRPPSRCAEICRTLTVEIHSLSNVRGSPCEEHTSSTQRLSADDYIDDLQNTVHFYRPEDSWRGRGRWQEVTDFGTRRGLMLSRKG